jgi:hypothetical protein
MSSAAAVIGLTYRGTDVQDEDGIFLEIVRGLLDGREVRGVDLIVPSSVGQVVRNRVAHRRSIELRGWIRGVDAGGEDADRADFADNRAAFLALFDETLEPGDLVATLEDGSAQTIAARTLNVIKDQVVPSFVNVSVELESVAPDWTITGS